MAGVVLFGFALTGCGGGNPDANTTTAIVTASSGNFHLYVSNQSFDIDPVDIQVFIDGKEVVNDTFKVESQHTWILFNLELEPEKHTLRAVGHGGEAELSESFVTSTEDWGVVEFWADPTEAPEPMFTFWVQDEQIHFA
jgi:hypothetical protein